MFRILSSANGYMKKMDDQGKFLKRTGDLLEKGYTFSEAIDFLLVPGRNGSIKLKKRITNSLQKGEPLSSIFDRQFNMPKQVSAQIYFAEHHGEMGATLKEAGDYLLKMSEGRQKLVKVLQYPLFLVMIAIMLMVLLRRILFPRFQSLYHSLGYDQSDNYSYLFWFIESFPSYFLGFILIVATIIPFIYLFRNKLFQVSHITFLIRFPLLSFFIKHGQTHFFARELSFLLKNGVSITESLKIIERQTYRPVLQYISKKLLDGLKEGRPLYDCTSKISFFQEELSYVVSHGQKNGRLADELKMYSEICIAELEEKGNKILKYIQPAIFTFVGLFIMAIYFSIMMPLFQMMQGI
ncbi:competence type IV pilus assembly protein ComGB [Rossellomorea oryzaecorticis]|uniref:Competence type IV pilus assembly protein ComGB n=1 Tax=Rossellomorea oryzaecorticis TaxID=1396505 RepID=A0ABW8VRM1_9BACI|nr:competence type IV pilus assembly protein ComGB [[Bacillus] enclensis]MBH9967429.1 type II secretion system F family protein [[Bacillus] enclensis]